MGGCFASLQNYFGFTRKRRDADLDLIDSFANYKRAVNSSFSSRSRTGNHRINTVQIERPKVVVRGNEEWLYLEVTPAERMGLSQSKEA